MHRPEVGRYLPPRCRLFGSMGKRKTPSRFPGESTATAGSRIRTNHIVLRLRNTFPSSFHTLQQPLYGWKFSLQWLERREGYLVTATLNSGSLTLLTLRRMVILRQVNVGTSSGLTKRIHITKDGETTLDHLRYSTSSAQCQRSDQGNLSLGRVDKLT